MFVPEIKTKSMSHPKGIRFPKDLEDFVEKQMKEHSILTFSGMVLKIVGDEKKRKENHKSKK